MRGSLFLRVFLGFWLVTVAILASWLIAARYFDALSFTPQAETERGPPQRMLLRLIYDLQNLEREALAPMLERLEHGGRVRIFILDSRGRELRQQALPPPVRRVAAQLDRDPPRGRLLIRTDQATFMGHRFYRSDSGEMRAILAAPKRQPELLKHLLQSLWLRLLIAVIISGLVCYGLSRLITRRLAALDEAAQGFARGDLETRIEVRERGGDETDALARSFNQMASELKARIDAQRQLLGDVSHELRSPLARLRIALALAQDDAGNRADHLQRIEHETERLEDLIGQLLGSHLQDLSLEDHVDVGDLLAEVCDNCRFEGEPEGKSVQYTAPRQPAVVATHGDLLFKCFDNLLRNALQYSATGGIISVVATSTPDDVLITIQDSGPGVPTEELDRIFDAFYRVDKARTRKTGGYGLGLSIARRAIEQHGGSISAENADGLRVTVRLPYGAGD
ncbi:MAG: ATP-binding protein [Pseudomonadota bacterium]